MVAPTPGKPHDSARTAELAKCLFRYVALPCNLLGQNITRREWLKLAETEIATALREYAKAEVEKERHNYYCGMHNKDSGPMESGCHECINVLRAGERRIALTQAAEMVRKRRGIPEHHENLARLILSLQSSPAKEETGEGA